MAEEVDWASIRQFRRTTVKPPSEWPSGVVPVSVEGLTLLGIDEDDELYWDGRRIEIRRRLELTRWQAAFVILGGTGAALTGVKDALDYFGVRWPWQWLVGLWA